MEKPTSTSKFSPQSVPKPRNTCDFPAGLITDYIKLVDQIRTNKK